MNIVTLLFVFLGSKITLANRTSFYTQEVLCLSELPMSELIQIKSTLGDEEGKLFNARKIYDLERESESERAREREKGISCVIIL